MCLRVRGAVRVHARVTPAGAERGSLGRRLRRTGSGVGAGVGTAVVGIADGTYVGSIVGVAEGTIVLPVTGMTCGGCVARLERTLRQTEGAEQVFVTLTPGQAEVHGPVTEATVRQVIIDAGFGVP